MDFEKRKAATLASLGSSLTDKSPKGSIDTPIIPLLHTINAHPSYFTTSSCSGRISIFSHPSSSSPISKKKARGGSWLFITHEPANPSAVLSLLHDSDSSPADPADLVFRFEPLIIAIECKDLKAAQFLVSLAISSGFRESGITSVSKRVIIAIRCSIRLEVPLGNREMLIVSPEYVKYLVEVANEKMESNRKRTEGFLDALRRNRFGGSGVSDDTNGVSGGEESTAESLEEVSCSGRFDGDDVDQKIGNGSTQSAARTLSAVQMPIFGEPMERLLLWGHSACTLNDINYKKILVFGGFGGMGRHARRNDSLLLDPLSGELKVIDVACAPSPRVGHTCSVIGDQLYVIGGRADPTSVLNDVWIFSISKRIWKLAECTGSAFPPRHRHSAAVIGLKIYVFGGLNNDAIISSLHVLDTESLRWTELPIGGQWPCARHSHSMVACGSQIFMFGGFSGEKALGDLYSFNVQACMWNREKTMGRSPHARFSHSMFIYKNHLGIIGGCPVRQHHQELSLIDLKLLMWSHVRLDSIGKDMFVRSTANVISEHLVMIGGGAACYAFGTKFSEPLKFNLINLMSFDNALKPSEHKETFVNGKSEGTVETKNNLVNDKPSGNVPASTGDPASIYENEIVGENIKYHKVVLCWVLKLEKRYAKLGKDILKKFGWLDVGRKVYSEATHICFPVTEKFAAAYDEECFHPRHSEDLKSFIAIKKVEDLSFDEVSVSAALNFLKEWGGTKMEDKFVTTRGAAKSPRKVMNEAVASLVKDRGLPTELLEQLPIRWERLGDIVVLPVTSFKDPLWDSIGEELWAIIAKSLNTTRLARQGRVVANGTRDSTLEILVGDNGWVEHRENGILYSFDATKCMFSWGNLSEKLRMAHLECTNEVIVDLFAGIGYFTLPFLVRAKAKMVYACEWNPHAVEALKYNLRANSVGDRCIVLEGDNRITAPKGVANRVCLGLLPTSEGSWATAVKALRVEGGVLHVHGNAKDSEEGLWTEHVINSILEIAKSEGLNWEVSVEHVERVKWYAPRIRHLVADVRCKRVKM